MVLQFLFIMKVVLLKLELDEEILEKIDKEYDDFSSRS